MRLHYLPIFDAKSVEQIKKNEDHDQEFFQRIEKELGIVIANNRFAIPLCDEDQVIEKQQKLLWEIYNANVPIGSKNRAFFDKNDFAPKVYLNGMLTICPHGKMCERCENDIQEARNQLRKELFGETES